MAIRPYFVVLLKSDLDVQQTHLWSSHLEWRNVKLTSALVKTLFSDKHSSSFWLVLNDDEKRRFVRSVPGFSWPAPPRSCWRGTAATLSSRPPTLQREYRGRHPWPGPFSKSPKNRWDNVERYQGKEAPIILFRAWKGVRDLWTPFLWTLRGQHQKISWNQFFLAKCDQFISLKRLF